MVTLSRLNVVIASFFKSDWCSDCRATTLNYSGGARLYSSESSTPRGVTTPKTTGRSVGGCSQRSAPASAFMKSFNPNELNRVTGDVPTTHLWC